MALAADAKGLKRICPSCGTRYYDFNKRPVQCPNCKTEFTLETSKAKTRRSRATVLNEELGQVSKKKGAAAAQEDEEDEDLLEEDDTLVSLDEVEDMEEDGAADEDLETEDPDLDLDDDIEDLEDLDDDLDDELDVDLDEDDK